MRTLIYSMSLNGEYSITLASLRFISDTHKDDTFKELIMPKNGVLTDDMLAQFKDADLVIFASGMYHFGLASQALESMNVIGEYMRMNCPHTAVTLFTTSGFMMDTIPHEQVRKWAERFGLRYIKGESILSADMLNEKYRADVYAWYNNVKVLVTSDNLRVTRAAAVSLVYTDDTSKTEEIAKQYLNALTAAGATVKEIRLSGYDFKHCLGCQYCYTDRKCFIKDDFEKLCNDVEAGTDVQLYVGALENGFYPTLFKRFMDRHVCIGRCPADEETIYLYAWHEGADYKAGDEELFKTWALSYASFGGGVLIDVCKGFKPDAVDATVAAFNENVGTYRNFYGTSLRRKFADLAYEIQTVEPLDYKYFAMSGDLKPVARNRQCRAIHSQQDARMAVEMKSMSVRMARNAPENLKAEIPERRKNMQGKSLIEWSANPPYADYEVKDSDLSPAAQAETNSAGGPPPMAIIGRKIGMRMGLLMNTFFTLVFSTIGTLSSGHFTWSGWLIGACVGWITAHMITSFIQPNEVQDKVLKKYNIPADSVKGRLLSSIITGCIIMPVMTIVMSITMPSLAIFNIERNISTMETEVIELYRQQSDLRSQQADLIKQRDELQGEQTALKAQQDALKTQMEKTIETAVNNAVAERQASVDELNASIAELEGQREELNKKLEAAQTPAEKGPLNGQLEGLNKQIEGMKNAVSEIEASIEATKAEIAESVKNGTPENPGMQAGIDGMQKGINEMQGGIDGMQAGIDGMQGGIDGMQQGIDGKSGGIEAQRNAIAGIKASLPKTLPLSALFQTLLGIVLGFFMQPLFLKFVMWSVLGKKKS